MFGYGKPGLGPPTIAAHNVFLSREAEGNGKYKRGEQHFGVIKPFFPPPTSWNLKSLEYLGISHGVKDASFVP